MIMKYWRRYSNTLFVSLNNRISVRKILSARGPLPACIQNTGILTSKVHSSAVHVELEVTTHVQGDDQEKMEDRSG